MNVYWRILLNHALMVVHLSQRVLVEYDQSVLLLKQNNLRLKSRKGNLKMKGRKNLMMDRIQQVL
jgi:hypothetical protein